MSLKIKRAIYFSFVIMSVFIILNFISLVTPKEIGIYLSILEIFCLIFLSPLFFYLGNVYTKKLKLVTNHSRYSNKLNELIIEESHNPLFYQGNITEGGKILTKKISEVLEVDRVSIWLYGKNKNSIICKLLYNKKDNTWDEGIFLNKKDFLSYFNRLETDPIIVANNAEKNEATSCFTERYLRPNKIKSMLDVPIIYRGEVIGVFCFENSKVREWLQIEINFGQIIASLYSFTYSIMETIKVQEELKEFEKFVDRSVLVSNADKKGKITYVNKKFEEVSGWELHETIGNDHNIVNSGIHPKEFWKEMYKTTVKEKKIWNDVIINKNKNGELYWVDSYIKADFDENGNLKGYRSIRYDVSEIIKQNIEIEKKNAYLEHAAKILRHDMHSGINTYIPRGINSLERRLTPEQIEDFKITAPLKMLKEGLSHTQKVYNGVYEFTNLVKKDSVLNIKNCDLKKILDVYLSTTSYKGQVKIHPLIEKEVNEPLFCTAIDNLIRNGLKYNDSNTKLVTIKMEENYLVIQDNGRGLTQEEFIKYSKPYSRKDGQKENGSGLGLNICIAILNEHGFDINCEKNEIGTKFKINLDK